MKIHLIVMGWCFSSYTTCKHPIEVELDSGQNTDHLDVLYGKFTCLSCHKILYTCEITATELEALRRIEVAPIRRISIVHTHEKSVNIPIGRA